MGHGGGGHTNDLTTSLRQPQDAGHGRLDIKGVLVDHRLHHNGVLVHDAREFIGATRHRDVATYESHGPTGPIALQDHGNPVRFRNIWVREL